MPSRPILPALFAAALLAACESQPKASQPPAAAARAPVPATVTPSRPAPATNPPKPAYWETVTTTMYVVTDSAEERLGPSVAATVTNRIYKGQTVTVYESADGWSRVSEYYPGTSEGAAGRTARWVAASSLGPTRPAPRQLAIPTDPRIPYLTRSPGDGLNERDVLILHAAARYYLETGQATRIEDGDKSLNRAGWYYLNFGGPTNTFFRPSDIPDLERRMAELQK